MKLCKDCRHISGGSSWCKRTQTGVNPVDGYPIYKIRDLETERRSIWPWRCGPDARYFEGK